MAATESAHVLPELPEDFVPEGARFYGVPVRERDGWTVVVPAYTIVGHGPTVHDAAQEAAELLEDYFRMCFADGLAFEQCERPIPARWFRELKWRLRFEALASALRFSRPSRRPERAIRLPYQAHC